MSNNFAKKITGLAAILAFSLPFYNCKWIQIPTTINSRVEYMESGEEFFACNSWDDLNQNKRLEIREIAGYNKKEFKSDERTTLIGKFSVDKEGKNYECRIFKEILGIKEMGDLIYSFYGKIDSKKQIIKVEFKPNELEKKAGIGNYVIKWLIENKKHEMQSYKIHKFEVK